VPYVRTQLELQPPAARNRFTPPSDWPAAVGGDARIKLPQSLTLTATLNPDFGQVEADPAVVNLTAFEVFFPERRPFFLENADGFAFGDTRTLNDSDPPRFFYSRRIGRAPQRRPERVTSPPRHHAADAHRRRAQALRYHARSGWQVGVLNAVTAHEHADVLRTDGVITREAVEPRANYHVSVACAAAARRQHRRGRLPRRHAPRPERSAARLAAGPIGHRGRRWTGSTRGRTAPTR
jgi:hypothetical protein